MGLDSFFKDDKVKQNNSNETLSSTDDVDMKKKNSDLFSMINNFFSDKKWSDYTRMEKSRNAFIINRFMMIGFPLQGAWLSQIGFPQWFLTEYWRNVIRSKYKSLPGWIYTKTKKQNPKQNLFDFSNEVYDYFYKMYHCSYKEVNELKNKFPDELIKVLKEIEKKLKTYK